MYTVRNSNYNKNIIRMLINDETGKDIIDWAIILNLARKIKKVHRRYLVIIGRTSIFHRIKGGHNGKE